MEKKTQEEAREWLPSEEMIEAIHLGVWLPGEDQIMPYQPKDPSKDLDTI